jgi:hypothetical protein
LPIDAALGLRKNQQDITTTFITELKDRISKAHEVATAATNKAARKQKDNYDHKVRGGTVQIGDRVLNERGGNVLLVFSQSQCCVDGQPRVSSEHQHEG